MKDEKDRQKALKETLTRVKQERIESLGKGKAAAEASTFTKLKEERQKLKELTGAVFSV